MGKDLASGGGGLFGRDFSLACASNLAFCASFQIMVGALPVYVVAIGGTESEVGLVTGMMLLASTVARPFAGRLSDKYAKSLLLVAACGIMAVAASLYYVAVSVPLLLVVRALQGVGIGCFVTAGYAMLADLVPTNRRGEAIGIWGMFNNASTALAPAIGVELFTRTNFTTVFVVAAVSGLIALLIVAGIKSARKPAATAGTAPGKLFERTAAYPAALAALLFYGQGALSGFLPLYAVRRGLGNVGLFFTLCAVGMVVSRLFCGRISDRHGRAVVIVPGSLLVVAAAGMLALTASPEMLAAAGLVYGLGFGAAHPAMIAMVADRIAAHRRGAGMSMVGVGTDSGWTVGGMVSGPIVQFAGFNAFFMVNAATALAGPVLMLLHSRRSRDAAILVPPSL